MLKSQLHILSLVFAIVYYVLFKEWIPLSSGLTYYISIGIYVLYNFYYLKAFKNKNYFCFEILFCLSYFGACLLYPLLIDQIAINDGYLGLVLGNTKAASQMRFFNLSLCAYYVYMFAMTKSDSQAANSPRHVPSYDKMVRLSNIFLIIGVLLFLYKGGMQILSRYSGNLGAFTDYGGVLFYLTIFYTISTMFNFLAISKNENTSIRFVYNSLSPVYRYSSIFIIGLMMISGYRSQAIQLLFPVAMMYVTYIKPIPLKRLIVLMSFGVALMIVIGFTRIGESVSLSGTDSTEYFRDYLMEGAGGVWLLEYTEQNGPTWGSNAILQMVSFIPFAQSVLVAMFGKDAFTESSSMMFTNAFRDDGTGLGTNMIGDLYYTFGIIGIIVCMYLLGWALRKVLTPKGLYQLLILLLLVGNSVFSTRVEFFYLFRSLGFAVIFLFVMLSITSSKRYASFNY